MARGQSGRSLPMWAEKWPYVSSLQDGPSPREDPDGHPLSLAPWFSWSRQGQEEEAEKGAGGAGQGGSEF